MIFSVRVPVEEEQLFLSGRVQDGQSDYISVAHYVSRDSSVGQVYRFYFRDYVTYDGKEITAVRVRYVRACVRAYV